MLNRACVTVLVISYTSSHMILNNCHVTYTSSQMTLQNSAVWCWRNSHEGHENVLKATFLYSLYETIWCNTQHGLQQSIDWSYIFINLWLMDKFNLHLCGFQAEEKAVVAWLGKQNLPKLCLVSQVLTWQH